MTRVELDIKALIKPTLLLIIVAFVANHLMVPEFFPLHPEYEFPMIGIMFSLIVGTLYIIIGALTFRYFKTHYFRIKVEKAGIVRFVLSYAMITALIYIPTSYLVAFYVESSQFGLRNMLSGLALSTLMSLVVLALFYAQPIFQLYRSERGEEGRLKVRAGRNIEYVSPSEIAYFISVQKIVFLIRTDGNFLVTDFTLQQLEEQCSTDDFFRVNRQILLQRNAVRKLVADKNGKMQVQLSVAFKEEDTTTVSRYKAKQLREWIDATIQSGNSDHSV